MRLKNWGKLLLILIIAGVLGIAGMPADSKEFVRDVPVVGAYLADSKISLGLDLQGGTHLDYRVVTAGVREADIDAIVAGVQEVLERRVNGIGVSEPNIFESTVADERHIIVELAGIKDVEEAKAIVGKTIQLEFKEQKTEQDPAEAAKITAKADAFLAAARAEPAQFEVLFEDYEAKPRIAMEVQQEWVWTNDLSGAFAQLAAGEAGVIHPQLIAPSETDYFITTQGQVALREGSYVAKLLEKETGVERVIEEAEQRKASHILIAFAGAERADDTVTRSEEDAQALAQDVLARATDGDFAALAAEYSDGPSAEKGGDLGFFGRGQMTPAFEDAVFDATETGLIDRVIRTSFGYHIIALNEIQAATSETTVEDRVKLAKAFFSTAPDGWQSTALTGQHFRRADVGSDQTTMRPIVNLYFTDVAVADNSVNWWELVWYLVALAAGLVGASYLLGLLFAEGKQKTLKKDIAIVILSAAVLAGAIYGIGETSQSATDAEKVAAEIAAANDGATISETDQAGIDLFAELTKRNVGKPMAIFLDGEPIIDGDPYTPGRQDYAPTVQTEITNGQAVITGLASYEEANQLAQNLNTGAIPAPIKLVGQYTIGATLGSAALATSLSAGALGLVIVMVFMTLYYRLPGIIASIALVIYGIVLLFLVQSFGVVLTLAGVAGVILSIGMAVDANILIFERLKEELKLGKPLNVAVEDGFARAWTSIRDSNVSSLITTAILYYFGSSIIQGFALMLAIGILVSMFTAITVTRAFLRVMSGRRMAKASWLFG